MTDVSGMSFDEYGRVSIRFDRIGLERLLDGLNDNSRGEFFSYIQFEPGTAEIVCNKLSWKQRLYANANREEHKN